MNIDQELLGQVNGLLTTIVGDLASQTFNQLSGLLSTQFGALLGSIGSLGSIFTGKRSLQFTQAHALLTEIQNQFQQTLQNSSINITNILEVFQTQVGLFLSNLTNPNARVAILAAAKQAKGDLADAFNDLLNQAMGHLTDIATSLANIGLATLLTTLSGKRGLFDGFGDILNGLTSTLSGHIDNLTTSIVQVGSSLLDATTPLLQDLQDQLTVHALNAAQSLLGTLAGISSTLQG